MTAVPRAEVTAADVETINRFLKRVFAGGDLHHLTLSKARELVKDGAPSGVLRAVAQLSAIIAIDKQIKKCTDETQLALLRGQLTLVRADAPPEEIFPLADLYRNLRSRSGKKRRKLGHRTALAVFSAAVTILKKGRTVDAVITEVATQNGINRKELKNFRNRLNRGLAHPGEAAAYQTALIYLEGMTRAELMAHLAGVSAKFCT